MENTNTEYFSEEHFSNDDFSKNTPLEHLSVEQTPQNPYSVEIPKPVFTSLSRAEQCAAVEALIFASEEPLSVKALYDLLIAPDEQPDKKQDKTTSKSTTKRTHKNDSATNTNGATNGHTNGHAQAESEASEISVHISTLAVELPEGFSEQLSDDLAQLAVTMPNSQLDELTQPLAGINLLQELIVEINADLEATRRVFRIVEVASSGGTKGYQFATKPEFGELLARLVKSKSKRRLSKAALETLAIIAYRQPISKPEIEVIRGVSSNEVINKLLEKNLVTITGRSESVGKPLLYGTTDDFLRFFGLHNLSDLPKPRELEELMHDRADILEAMQPAADEASAEIAEEV